MSIISDITGFFKTSEKASPENFQVQALPYEDYTVRNKDYLNQNENWTYKAIDIKGKAVGSLKFKLYDTKRNEIETHQFLTDITYPNQFLTYSQLIYIIIAHLSTAGASYTWIKQSDIRGYKFQLYPLNPQQIKIVPDKITGLPKQYIYTDGNGSNVTLEINEVMAITNPDIANWLKAYSPLQASSYAHDIIEHALKYNANLFGNMGALKGFIVAEGASNDELGRLRAMFKEQYVGTRNAGKMGIVDKMLSFIKVGETPKELDFLGAYETMRDTVLAIQGVPKDLVIGGSTYENAKEAQRIFQLYTIRPLALQIQEAINRTLLIKYGVQYTFEIENAVEVDKEAITRVVTAQYTTGIITQNEAREVLGYDALEQVDTEPQTDTEQAKALDELKEVITDTKTYVKKMTNVSAREEFKKVYEQKLLKDEKKVKEMMDKFFKEQEQRVIKSLESSKGNKATAKLPFNVAEENAYLDQTMKEITRFVVDTYTEFGIELSEAPASTTIRPALAKQLDKTGLLRSKDINTTTKDKLISTISEALTNETPRDELIKQIESLYEGFTTSRSETIAQTEVARIGNATKRDIYSQSDRVSKFEWVAIMQPGVTRDAHLGADGDTAPRGGKFLVGGEMLAYPGDPTGSPENTINCRCTLVPVLD